jgi:Protein-tyrosine-phosphatase-like, N-terminal domain
MATEDGSESDTLASAAARLTARYGRLIAAETIHEVLHETYQSLLSNATITTFLPILAERSAATQLADTTNGSPPRTHHEPLMMPRTDPPGRG